MATPSDRGKNNSNCVSVSSNRIIIKMKTFKDTLEEDISDQLPTLSGEDAQALLEKVLEVVECIDDLPHVEPLDLQPPLKKATAKRFVTYLQTKYGDRGESKKKVELQAAGDIGNKPKVPDKPSMNSPKIFPKPKPSQPSPLALRDEGGPRKLLMNSPKIPPKPFPKLKSPMPSPHGSPRTVRPLINYPASQPISDNDDSFGKLTEIKKMMPVAICVTTTEMKDDASASTASSNSEIQKYTMEENKQKSPSNTGQSQDVFAVQLEHLSVTVASLARSQALRVKRRPCILPPSHQRKQNPDLDSLAAVKTDDLAALESIPIYMALDVSKHKLEQNDGIHGSKSCKNEEAEQGLLPPQVGSAVLKGSPNDSNNADGENDLMSSALPQYKVYKHSFSTEQKDLVSKVNYFDKLRPSSAEYDRSSSGPEKNHAHAETYLDIDTTSIDEESLYANVYEISTCQPDNSISYANDNDDYDDDDLWSLDEFDSDEFSDEEIGDGMKMDEPSPVEKQAINARKRKHIATELLTTERAYVKRLHLIDQEFHLKTVIENRSHQMFPDDVIPQMFSNIKSIYQLHNDFLLPQLEKRMADWDNTPKIGDLMRKFAPFLKLYSEYIKNFAHATRTIDKWQQRSTKFAELLAELQNKPECGSLTLQDHMLEPVQRVPRYEMLFKDYLKYLEEDSEDRLDTEKALELVTTAATNANKTMVEPGKFWSLLELNRMLRWRCAGVVDLTDTPRELIKEGQIFKVSARSGTLFTRYLFLFTDMLLVCTDHRKLGMYHVHNVLKVDTMQVLEGDDPEAPLTFRLETNSKRVELQGSNQEEKLEWFSIIQSMIKGRPRSEHSEMDHRLGHCAPRWVKDRDMSMCMLCAATFSIMKRRHHCRCCGIVVCGECSPNKVPLPYQDNKPDRVCGICYEALKLQTDKREVKGSDQSVVSGMMLLSSDKTIWERRWFALHEDFVLYSFKGSKDVQALTSISLPGKVVTEATKEDNIDKEHVIKISHSDNTNLLYIHSPNSWIKWLIALQRAVHEELPPNFLSKKKEFS